MEKYDLVVIGGGPAGLAAAVSAREHGIKEILILERDKELGGILNQCIHNGFGLHTFREELTGPEYAARYVNRVKELEIEYRLDTMVVEISGEKMVTAVSKARGLEEIRAKAVILAMGCRERPRGALNIPGYRPAGIYSAGTAQRLVNMEGFLPGREVVILGSGDIGLIMARRMTLEGARVRAVAELMPYSGGLKRNIVQCLEDFGIPLKLSTTVVDIKGKDRVEGVTLAKVDEKGKPVPGTEEEYSCDTLLLSCGLIPENELSQGLGLEMEQATNGPVVNESLETSLGGVFACGNVLHVHDLVDFVSEEAAAAGKAAAAYIGESGGAEPEGKDADRGKENAGPEGKGMDRGGEDAGPEGKGAYRGREDAEPEGKGAYRKNGGDWRGIPVIAGKGVRYTVPKTIRPERMEESLTIRFRVGAVYQNCFVGMYLDDRRIHHRKKRVMAPGEMEEISIRKSTLLEQGDVGSITIVIEED